MSLILKLFKIMDQMQPMRGSVVESHLIDANGWKKINIDIERTKSSVRKKLGDAEEVGRDSEDENIMIDDTDLSVSTIRLLASQTLKKWTVSSILKLLEDDDYVVRTLASRELHQRGGQDVFDEMVKFSSSPTGFVREIAAFVLGQLGTPNMPFKNESLPILLRLITDDQSEVRAAAAAAMGHICFSNMPEEVEESLYKAASDVDNDVRCCVASSLGNASRTDKTWAVLDVLLQDSDSQVREYAQLGKDILLSK